MRDGIIGEIGRPVADFAGPIVQLLLPSGAWSAPPPACLISRRRDVRHIALENVRCDPNVLRREVKHVEDVFRKTRV